MMKGASSGSIEDHPRLALGGIPPSITAVDATRLLGLYWAKTANDILPRERRPTTPYMTY